jgi:hypothetical protein
VTRNLPPANLLTYAQYSGWACVWCGASLQNGGVLAGRAQGSVGAHDMSVDVYACRDCSPSHPHAPACQTR